MIQIVTVKWGERYGAAAVNGMAREITRHTTEPIRFICITDDDQKDFDANIETRPFPDLGAPFDELKSGCRLKLAMFYPEMLEPDEIALFFDLDTAIVGDVARLATHVRLHPGLHMLHSHWLEHWRVRRIGRMYSREYYFFGNSSVVGFVPRDMLGLVEAFKRGMDRIKSGENCSHRFKKAHASDDRFESFYAWDRVRTWPASLAVKFPLEYMSQVPGLASVMDRIIWVKKRRSNQVAVTFVGTGMKPDQVVKFQNGQVIRYKGYSLRWSHNVFRRYWEKVLGSAEPADDGSQFHRGGTAD